MKPHSIYFWLLKTFLFNKKKYGNNPSPIGRVFLKILPDYEVTLSNGLTLSPSYFHRRWLIASFRGCNEPALDQFISKVLKPGDNAIDVGGQVGIFSSMMSKAIGSDAKLLIVEPDQNNLTILETVMIKNAVSSYTILKMALDSSEDISEFSRETHSGLTQITANHGHKPKNVELVETITLDRIWEDVKKEVIDFIKIDVDGPDLNVLLGGRKIISSSRPMIVFEISRHWKHYGHSSCDAFKFLSEFGYQFWSSLLNEDKFQHIKATEKLPDDFGLEKSKAVNILCLHPDIHADRIKLLNG